MNLPTAWIITLNKDKDNVIKLQQDLETQGLHSRTFAAVDGRAGPPELHEGESVSQFQALVNRKAPLTNSEMGCYFSHLRVIRQAFDAGETHVFILEDDIVLEDNLLPLLSSIIQLDEHFHLVRLMSLKIRKRKVLADLGNDYKLVRPVRGALGTQGYILNRQGMERVLNYGSVMTMPIDKLYDSFFLFDLNCYSVEPHAIYELAHTSSIIKTAAGLDGRLWVRGLWRLNKLKRSIYRKINSARHRKEVANAQKPDFTLGKSARLRH